MSELVKLLLQDLRARQNLRSMVGMLDSVASAYDVQDLVVAQFGPICGRKIALNTPKALEMAGIIEPIVGYIVGERTLPDQCSLRLSDYSELALEPEFVAVLGHDVPARRILHPAEVLDFVDRFSLGFKVLDRRRPAAGLHIPTYIANNVFNAGCVISDIALDPDRLVHGQYEIAFHGGGGVIMAGTKTAPQNPIEACAFIINHFTARNQKISAGETLLLGAHHPPLAVPRAGEYRFSLTSGEAVSLSISA
jgi:2-keto-4-pentenoate hydratase